VIIGGRGEVVNAQRRSRGRAGTSARDDPGEGHHADGCGARRPESPRRGADCGARREDIVHQQETPARDRRRAGDRERIADVGPPGLGVKIGLRARRAGADQDTREDW
jgi:hypothetical protein